MGDQVRLHIEQLGLEVTVRQVGPASAGPLASGSAAPASGEAVERIAGGIAHELNNVLTAIAGYNELILGKMSESNPLRRDAAEIERAVERASALARHLLAIARRQVFELRVLDLNALLESLEPRLRELAGPGVALDLVLDPGTPRAFASPELVEEAVVLLAGSAVGAMGGSGALRIATSASPPAEDAPSGLVRIELADTGPEPSPAELECLFELFAAEPPGRGSGLALAAARGMILQSGGRLEVEVEPGLTTMRASLPAAGGGPEPPALAGSERQTVLVAEDVEVIRRMVAETLERRGYRVLAARDGREALALAAQPGPIDLLLTDVAMPGLDGVALAQALRETRPGIRVLYMSGSPAAHVARDLELAPGTGFIAKPITPSSLALRVRQALEERPAV